MIKTQQLKNLLAQYKATLSPNEFLNLADETDRLIELWIDKLGNFEQGPERAQKTQEAIDFQNNDYSHITTSCKKGCGFCCHLEIEITEDDAERLADVIVKTGLGIDKDRLKAQSERPRMDKAWAQGPKLENRCVLLGADNSCQAYDSRPSTCRKHSVVSPVEECATPGGIPVPRMIPMNEIIISASINLPQNRYGSFSKMLSKALAMKTVPHSLHHLDFVEVDETPIRQGPDLELEAI